ncbi:MAG TPA: hypothetical protein V6D29_12290 [Leptolyngbyaceae cyanobacterium]
MNPSCTLTSPVFKGQSLSVKIVGDIEKSSDIGIVVVEGSELLEDSLRAIWSKLHGIRGESPGVFEDAPWGYSDWDDLKYRLNKLPSQLWDKTYSEEPTDDPFVLPEGLIH